MLTLARHRTRRINLPSSIFNVTLLACLFVCLVVAAEAQTPRWSAKLDGEVRFYQTTEMGVLLAGTDKSLYALDAESGEALWRRKNARLDETDVAPVPATDLVLLSFEGGDKTRIEAADILTGDAVWQSEKVRGTVMQMTIDGEARLLAVVLVRDARGRAREGFKRRAVIHVFDLATGEERWKRDVESEVEMLPARWNGEAETAYTLDNYRAPLFLDGRLFFFYEGVSSVDAGTGKDTERERFRVNEEGLALTEADPVFDEGFMYTSGRGRVRAVSRATSEVAWEAKDLGLTPEILLTRSGVLYVRTGGQFTRLGDGETVERGPYGVSAIDSRTGKTLWRYKGADKGITNLALPDDDTILIADRDDLIFLDARTGTRRAKVKHEVERAAFVLINEEGQAVVGGQNTIEGFDVASGERVWLARHTPPGRGLLRTVAAVAARATALYFRYGGVATTAFRGARLARAATGLRSGLRLRAAVLPSLQSLATDAARDTVATRFTPFGIATRLDEAGTTATSAVRRARQVESLRTARLPRPSVDVEERLLDRLDPARQLDRLAGFLMRRRRLAALRGEWMYFYTDLDRQGSGGGRGLAGVNINNGRTERAIPLGEPDERFVVDESNGLLHTARDNRIVAYQVRSR